MTTQSRDQERKMGTSALRRLRAAETACTLRRVQKMLWSGKAGWQGKCLDGLCHGVSHCGEFVLAKAVPEGPGRAAPLHLAVAAVGAAGHSNEALDVIDRLRAADACSAI